MKIIISAGKRGTDIKDFIKRFVSKNKSESEYVRNRLVGYFWGVSDMGGRKKVVKDDKVVTGHEMAYVIVDEWESGVEFEIL